jgi:hypothetical protein
MFMTLPQATPSSAPRTPTTPTAMSRVMIANATPADGGDADAAH